VIASPFQRPSTGRDHHRGGVRMRAIMRMGDEEGGVGAKKMVGCFYGKKRTGVRCSSCSKEGGQSGVRRARTRRRLKEVSK